jgi:hypothetical protein
MSAWIWIVVAVGCIGFGYTFALCLKKVIEEVEKDAEEPLY